MIPRWTKGCPGRAGQGSVGQIKEDVYILRLSLYKKNPRIWGGTTSRDITLVGKETEDKKREMVWGECACEGNDQ